MPPPHPAPLLKPMARDPRPVEYGSIWWTSCPDTRQSTTSSTTEPPIWTDPPRSDASWRKISERSRAVKSTGSTLERQITAAAAAAGAPIATAAGTGQLQHDYETRTRLDNIPCYQWSKDRITRPRVPQISGQTAQFRGKSTGIRRPRTPCRPAGAWAMFLTNSCHKNDMGYNYVIAGLFRGPDP